AQTQMKSQHQKPQTKRISKLNEPKRTSGPETTRNHKHTHNSKKNPRELEEDQRMTYLFCVSDFTVRRLRRRDTTAMVLLLLPPQSSPTRT
ncbi:hypothetical protein PIB30_057159, partial [Stylosanthes scabra]|nr:hypothetical protein [Stylosanthes scabra]